MDPWASVPVFYGTQTGISEEFAQLLQQASADVPLVATNISLLTREWLVQTRVAVFVCSSHGDGDPPDSATQFFAMLKNEPAGGGDASIGKNDDVAQLPLRNLRFALLGLGDLNYINYQGFPKALEKELLRLGATLWHVRGEADNSDDIDDDFEQWRDSGFWTCLAEEWKACAGQPYTIAEDEVEDKGGAAVLEDLQGGAAPAPVEQAVGKNEEVAAREGEREKANGDVLGKKAAPDVAAAVASKSVDSTSAVSAQLKQELKGTPTKSADMSADRRSRSGERVSASRSGSLFTPLQPQPFGPLQHVRSQITMLLDFFSDAAEVECTAVEPLLPKAGDARRMVHVEFLPCTGAQDASTKAANRTTVSPFHVSDNVSLLAPSTTTALTSVLFPASSSSSGDHRGEATKTRNKGVQQPGKFLMGLNLDDVVASQGVFPGKGTAAEKDVWHGLWLLLGGETEAVSGAILQRVTSLAQQARFSGLDTVGGFLRHVFALENVLYHSGGTNGAISSTGEQQSSREGADSTSSISSAIFEHVNKPRPYTLVGKTGVCVTHQVRGQASTFLCRDCAVGDRLLVKAVTSPLRLLDLQAKLASSAVFPRRPLVLIATGAGMGVFVGWLRQFASSPERQVSDVTLFSGCRSWTEVPYCGFLRRFSDPARRTVNGDPFSETNGVSLTGRKGEEKTKAEGGRKKVASSEPDVQTTPRDSSGCCLPIVFPSSKGCANAEDISPGSVGRPLVAAFPPRVGPKDNTAAGAQQDMLFLGPPGEDQTFSSSTRTPNDDFRFEWHLALSREGGKKKYYVQDALRAKENYLRQKVDTEGGIVYFCGEGKMIKDCILYLRSILSPKAFEEKRIVAEQWGTTRRNSRGATS
ncbi:unnamed protein product [Amoebophrya sp. A25]|nr:unnamed protein product [Amoebophrya sp. A25]|eukprot:GSA25T00006213001.1